MAQRFLLEEEGAEVEDPNSQASVEVVVVAQPQMALVEGVVVEGVHRSMAVVVAAAAAE